MYVQDSYAILLELVSKTLTLNSTVQTKKKSNNLDKIDIICPSDDNHSLRFPRLFFLGYLIVTTDNDKINCNNSLEFTPIL